MTDKRLDYWHPDHTQAMTAQPDDEQVREAAISVIERQLEEIATLRSERDEARTELEGGRKAIRSLLAIQEKIIAERDEARAALEPFAKMADQVDRWQQGTDPVFPGAFNSDDLRRARAARGGKHE